MERTVRRVTCFFALAALAALAPAVAAATHAPRPPLPPPRRSTPISSPD